MELSKIILIGFMGSGKSDMGKRLAKQLERPFVDLDEYIEEKEGQSIKDIFKSLGAPYFREIESKYLKELLNRKEELVLALGGGTPCNKTNLTAVLKYRTIYLKCPIAILADRLWTERSKRPLISLLENKKALYSYVQKTLSIRKLFYKKAHIVVWNLGKPDEVLKRIIKRI